MLKQTQSNFRFNFSGWFSQGDIYLPGFPRLPLMVIEGVWSHYAKLRDYFLSAVHGCVVGSTDHPWYAG